MRTQIEKLIELAKQYYDYADRVGVIGWQTLNEDDTIAVYVSSTNNHKSVRFGKVLANIQIDITPRIEMYVSLTDERLEELHKMAADHLAVLLYKLDNETKEEKLAKLEQLKKESEKLNQQIETLEIKLNQ